MPNYRRARIPGGTCFFTLALAERGQSLLLEHIGALRSAYAWTQRLHPFRTDAIVVLPDHLHAIWTLPEGRADFALRWKLIKDGFSRRLPRVEQRSSSRHQGERGIWQRRYWEHAIRDENDLVAHVDYVHLNPVKHGHVQRVADWRHSSFHRFVRLGRLAPDWGEATS